MRVVTSNYTNEQIEHIIDNCKKDYNFKEDMAQRFKRFIAHLIVFVATLIVNTFYCFFAYKFLLKLIGFNYNDVINFHFKSPSDFSEIALFSMTCFLIYLKLFVILEDFIIKMLRLDNLIHNKTNNEIINDKVKKYKLAQNYLGLQEEIVKYSNYEGVLTDNGNIKLVNYIDDNSGLYKEKILYIPDSVKNKIYKNESINFDFIDNMILENL